MQEYDWRQGREKFRPDFQKDVPSEPAMPMEKNKKPSFSRAYVLFGVLLLAALAAGIIFIIRQDGANQLADAAEKHKTAVGLVALSIEYKSGKKDTRPLGTAWAVSKNQFATNAHVAAGLKKVLEMLILKDTGQLLEKEAARLGHGSLQEYLNALGAQKAAVLKEARRKALGKIQAARADIILNGTRHKSFSATHVQIHKDYGRSGTNYNPDVALLTISGSHDNYFKLADRPTLENLKSGTPIAFLGFPSENLAQSNVNIDNPVASMQSGIVVASTDFDMKDAGKNNQFLRHNLPATGGASGSPIFNRKGEVVALLYGGNTITQIKNGRITRAPSAAQINFAVRADLLSEVGDAVAIKDFLLLK